MSEAIISRRGNSTGSSTKNRITFQVIENTNWKVPEAYNSTFDIYLIGGGGAGGCGSTSLPGSIDDTNVFGGGGGSGCMNNNIMQLVAGTMIPITIGSGGSRQVANGVNGNSGGTTSFGAYMSANGGEGGFGRGDGGNGGAGGGAGSIRNDSYAYAGNTGGQGYQFGGGGCGDIFTAGGHRGWGGPWGGGGGGYSSYYRNGPQGGTYGGNGESKYASAEAGTNTIGWNNVFNDGARDYTGSGIAGVGGNMNTILPGGGGFGGIGGGVIRDGSLRGSHYPRSGGGGGYAGNGGWGDLFGCGGGGGFGRDGKNANNGGGGGGGFAGGYGDGGNGGCYSSYYRDSTESGNSGICIIQYYT